MPFTEKDTALEVQTHASPRDVLPFVKLMKWMKNL